jgi:hypothetical protein
MNDSQYIFDKKGKLIGTQTTSDDGKVSMTDDSGRLLGNFDGNFTRDRDGKIVAQNGNTLAQFLH